MELRFLYLIYQTLSQKDMTIYYAFDVISHQLLLVFYFIALVLFANTSIIMAVAACILLTIWSIKIAQLIQIQSYQSGSEARFKHIQWIMTVSRKILIYILTINPLMGKIFLLFLIINFPINCFLLMRIIFGNSEFIFKFVIAMICNQQMVVIILLHFIIAKFNGKFLKPNLKTIHIAVHYSKWLTEQMNIKINLFIQAFHTKQRYGITYWKFGIVSFGSYWKVN